MRQSQGAGITRVMLVGVLALGLGLSGCGGDDSAASTGKPFSSQTSERSADDAKPLVSGLPDFTRLVREVSPAVVNVSALPPKADSDANAPADPSAGSGALGDWLRHFFGDGDGKGQSDGPGRMPGHPDIGPHVSLGSGFIISSDGYILTNRHVIKGAGQIVVKLNDRRQLLAQVVGADADSDIAVLKVDAKDLPTVAIGNPDKLDVGAWVVAIGSPFGFETSVTAGIVSAKNRNLADNQYVPFLQTDVAINPGNSGGPLFNLAGQVVGINAQIYSQTGGYQGVSFAIPIDIAMNAARQLRDHGRVVRGWLGVQIQNVDRKLAASFDLARPVGALVTQILKNSPAADSDLQVGDIILSFDGRTVDSAADLPALVGVVSPGQKSQLTVLRDGHKEELSITVQALPARLAAGGGAQSADDSARDVPFGLSLAPLKPAERKKLSLGRQGVRVTAVQPGAAADAGLQAGDVILSAGRADVASPQALKKTLRKAKGTIALLVLRDGARRYLPLDTRDDAKTPAR